MNFSRVVAEIPQLKRGMCWCRKCGRVSHNNANFCLRNGWPKCCGETMTIDSPEERAEFAVKDSLCQTK